MLNARPTEGGSTWKEGPMTYRKKHRQRGCWVSIIAEQETESFCCPGRGDNPVCRVMFDSKQASNCWSICPSMGSQSVWLFMSLCKPRSLSDGSRHSYFHMYPINQQTKNASLQGRPQSVPYKLNCPFSPLPPGSFSSFYFLILVFHMNFTPPASTSLALIMSMYILLILLCMNSSKTHKLLTH